ncbi:MAG: alpha-galactosidase, partial [Aquiluna sp.]
MSLPKSVIISQAGVSVVFDLSDGTPQILHWGADLGAVDTEALRLAAIEPTAHAELDAHQFHGIWRENARGNISRPTLLGHRNGSDFTQLFTLTSVD